MGIKRADPTLFLLFIPAIISAGLNSNLIISAIIPIIIIIFSYFNKFQFKENSIGTTIYTLLFFGIVLVFHSFVIKDLPAGNGPHVMGLSMMYLISILWYYKQNVFISIIIAAISLISLLFTGNNAQFLGNNTYYFIVYSSIPLLLTFLYLFKNKAYQFYEQENPSTIKKEEIKNKISAFVIFNIIGAIFFVSILTFSFNKGLFWVDKVLNQQLMDYITKDVEPDSGIGLAADFELKSQSSLKMNNEIVLTVKSKTKIDYLKAQVFNYYEKNKWLNTINKKLDPIIMEKPLDNYVTFNNITEKDFKNENILNEGVLTFISKKDTFTPLPYYAKVFKKNESIHFNNLNIVEKKNNLDFLTFYGNSNDLLKYNKNIIENSKLIDPFLKKALYEKTLEITKEGRNNTEKAKLLQKYFNDNFTYSLDVNFNANKNLILDFIFDKKTGFCSHFSTATVLMLRSIDIPANIVSGYLTDEYDTYLNEYIVREKDAHAWVEFYDNKSNFWVKIDPTPIKQMFEKTNNKNNSFDKLSLYYKSLISKIKNKLSFDFFIKIIMFLVSVLSIIILVLFLYNRSKKNKKIITYENKDIEIKKISDKLNNLLIKNNIIIDETKTYGEIKAILKEMDELPNKDSLIEIITFYEKIRYNLEKENIDKLNNLIIELNKKNLNKFSSESFDNKR
ncbi:MAG: transglutaminase-like domain-containing protein [Candidatus Sericytochromatia bacterium]